MKVIAVDTIIINIIINATRISIYSTKIIGNTSKMLVETVSNVMGMSKNIIVNKEDGVLAGFFGTIYLSVFHNFSSRQPRP